jgi:hypothetical protein
VLIVACVISIGHWTDTASTKCVLRMFVNPVPVLVPTRHTADGAVLPFSVAQYADVLLLTLVRVPGPERCVLKCTCTLPGVRITAQRQIHQKVSMKEAAQFTRCCTVHVVLYGKNRAPSAILPRAFRRRDVRHCNGSDGRFWLRSRSRVLMKYGPVATVSVIHNTVVWSDEELYFFFFVILVGSIPLCYII